MMDVRVFSNPEALVEFAAGTFIRLAEDSIQQRGMFTVAFSGGSTPRRLYNALAAPEVQKSLDWDKIHLFWGDERAVPPDHSDSNYKMVREALLDKVTIPQENIHRVHAEMDVRMAAFQYEEELRGVFEGDWPRFDLVLLGMGEDGHTASLFPNSAGLNEEQRWFIANYAPKRQQWRLTLTGNAINAARNVLALVQGGGKADMIAAVLVGGDGGDVKPIQRIKPADGKMTWLLDGEAAGKLPADLVTLCG